LVIENNTTQLLSEYNYQQKFLNNGENEISAKQNNPIKQPQNQSTN
jgi:hypothetical protein